MVALNACPHCGKPVSPTTALGGLCVECMLKAGLASRTEPGQTESDGVADDALQPPSPAELASLFPQLEIVEFIGRGGMSAVYKARQPKLDRFVALKLLSHEKQNDRRFMERFTREARALAKLSHPSIVAVYDFGETSGRCYLVMEYVDGLSLRQVIRDGKLAPETALGIVPRICEALQFAHEQGIVHRDIKPENILLDRQGRVKIADFGIAKILRADGERENLTADEQIIGTPHYMAPEQVEHPQRVDHRADIYSLGVVFYEMLTGELPLGKFQPPSSRAMLDARLDEVVLRALEKEPDRRYQHASQVKTDVETIVATPDRKDKSNGNASRQPNRKIGRLLLMLAAIVVASVLAAWIVHTGTRATGVNRSKGEAAAPSSAPTAVAAVPTPPVVVKTIPESGSRDVDPALNEISVVFSKPMQDGAWSWSTWGEDHYPETTGEIHYIKDQRTCVLPVKLKSGHVYALWINSSKFHNFTDQAGEPAVPYLLIFETRK